MTEVKETREAWLDRAVAAMTPWIDELEEPGQMPPVHVSVGFPGGRANRKRTIGQCWASDASADGVGQIFISPVRGTPDTVNVLGTLLHEMVHAADDCKSGHRGSFARRAKALGFVAPLTISDNRSDELNERLHDLAAELTLFPHAALGPSTRGSEEKKKQESRMIKLTCPSDGYIVRTSRKWLDVGPPTCPCGEQMEES